MVKMFWSFFQQGMGLLWAYYGQAENYYGERLRNQTS
jgi:hypothetical protein